MSENTEKFPTGITGFVKIAGYDHLSYIANRYQVDPESKVQHLNPLEVFVAWVGILILQVFYITLGSSIILKYVWIGFFLNLDPNKPIDKGVFIAILLEILVAIFLLCIALRHGGRPQIWSTFVSDVCIIRKEAAFERNYSKTLKENAEETLMNLALGVTSMQFDNNTNGEKEFKNRLERLRLALWRCNLADNNWNRYLNIAREREIRERQEREKLRKVEAEEAVGD